MSKIFIEREKDSEDINIVISEDTKVTYKLSDLVLFAHDMDIDYLFMMIVDPTMKMIELNENDEKEAKEVLKNYLGTMTDFEIEYYISRRINQDCGDSYSDLDNFDFNDEEDDED